MSADYDADPCRYCGHGKPWHYMTYMRECQKPYGWRPCGCRRYEAVPS